MKILKIIFALLALLSIIYCTYVMMQFQAFKKQCEANNGFLWKTSTGLHCIPYRNDMQKDGSYPQP